MSDTSYTKHTTHTDALDTLGTVIGPNEGRDAIHVAVFPVEAMEYLRPGDHVYLTEDGAADLVTAGKVGVGIVDPFLTKPVRPGEWFWLLVYPRQITSLRHVWEHPSFPASRETDYSIEDLVTATADPIADMIAESDSKAFSERWLREWIATADCPDFHTTIGAMLDQQDGVDWGSEYVHFAGQDAHGEIPAEAWHHLSVYAGVNFEGERPKWFSCSC